jgi:hypothetical protein
MNLKELAKDYIDYTGMAEKLSLIDHFRTAVDLGEAELALALILRIKNDFPFTGTHYYFEAEKYEDQLREMLEISHLEATKAC